MQKLHVALMYGGVSPEHEISIRSTRNVAEMMDLDLFTLTLIGIDKKGKWFLKTKDELINEEVVLRNNQLLSIVPGGGKNSFFLGEKVLELDVVFPLIHGASGEDGSIQGLLKLLNLPYVGCDILSSAVCMDKAVTKEILSYHHIPNTPFELVFKSGEVVSYAQIAQKLGKVLYIKPVNLGSSVGVSKAMDEESFQKALALAFQYDHKVLIEKNIDGREMECAILGNMGNAKASKVGEVITVKAKHDFYTYEAKYLDAGGSYVQVPADLPLEVQEKIRHIALKTYTALGCKGLARVDVFYTKEGAILVNEVNTMPGFTAISMYPKMWEASGITYKNLITNLIRLGMEAFRNNEEIRKGS